MDATKPGKGIEAGHNKCRNPDGAGTIWCYTTDPFKRWEYCEPVEWCKAKGDKTSADSDLLKLGCPGWIDYKQ